MAIGNFKEAKREFKKKKSHLNKVENNQNLIIERIIYQILFI